MNEITINKLQDIHYAGLYDISINSNDKTDETTSKADQPVAILRVSSTFKTQCTDMSAYTLIPTRINFY